MATADELLAMTSETDDNTWFEVDLVKRTINIPKRITNIGVESDDDVQVVKFKMPRFYNNVDFSDFIVGINYTNAAGEGDRYEPTDVTVLDDTITFSWIVGRHAAMHKGNVHFSLCLKKVDPSDPASVIGEFNTTIASLPILEGLETSEQAIAEFTDLLEEWRNQLFGAGDPLDKKLFSNALVGNKTGGHLIVMDDMSPTESGITINLTLVDSTELLDTHTLLVAGTNILPLPSDFVDIGLYPGLAVTIDDTKGTVKISGTAALSDQKVILNRITLPPGTYYIAANAKGSDSTFYIGGFGGTSGNTRGFNVTLTETTTDDIYFMVKQGQTIDKTFIPMVAVSDTVVNKFEKYKGTVYTFEDVPRYTTTLSNIPPVTPATTVMFDTSDVTMNVSYNKDINKVISDIYSRLGVAGINLGDETE